MTHPSELISAYLDGELSADEHSKLSQHLGTCGECAAELEEVQVVRAAVRALPVVELPPGIIPEADDVVVPMHKNRGVWVGAAAAVPEPSALVMLGITGSLLCLRTRRGGRV